MTSHLCLDLICICPELFHLGIVISSFKYHFVVFSLQAVNCSLICQFLVFRMPMCPLKLVLGIGKLFFNSLFNRELLLYLGKVNPPLVVTSVPFFQCLYYRGGPGDQPGLSVLKRGHELPFRSSEAARHNHEYPIEDMSLNTF